MALLTMVVGDGMPLAESIDKDRLGSKKLVYVHRARGIFRNLDEVSPSRCSIESDQYVFHYLNECPLRYVVLVEQTCSQRLAFSFLEDIDKELRAQCGGDVFDETWMHISSELDTCIQKAKNVFTDSLARCNPSSLNTELQDVQRMHIDDIISTEVVPGYDPEELDLPAVLHMYSEDARFVNTYSMCLKAAVGFMSFIVVLAYLVL